MSMMVLHSEVPIRPDSREAAIEICKEMAATSRTEPGVIDYRVTVDLEAPNVIRIIEQYEDSEAVEAHESSAHLDAFQAKMEPHLAEDATLYQFTVDEKIERPGP